MQTFVKGLKKVIEEEIPRSSCVFIVGHNHPDFDSIGSAIGLATLAKNMGREVYIIVDDNPATIEPGVKKVIDQAKDKYRFITKEDYLRMVDSRSLLFLTDVSKKELVSIGDLLDKARKTIVIDHHSEDERTLDILDKFINGEVSSASEIVTMLLSQCKVKYGKDVANYLLAGISLDTKRFKQNTSHNTLDVAEHLLLNGADMDTIQELFAEDYHNFCKIANLVIYGTNIETYLGPDLASAKVSYTLDREGPNSIFQREDMAKAADRMLRFQGIDASFAMGFIAPGEVHISGRSNKRVDVGKIMQALGGGGTSQTGAALIEASDIFDVEKQLKNEVDKVLIKFTKE